MINNAPTQLGIDPDNPVRCFIAPPIDIPYMMAQRKLLQSLVTEGGVLSYSEPAKEEIKNLIGFLDHFIAGVYFVAAEYNTPNRTRY